MRVLLLALVLLNTVAIATEERLHDRIVYEDAASGFRFPQMIAAYELVDMDDLGPQLGTAIHYSEAEDSKASVYVYNKGFGNLANGTGDMRLRHEISSIDDALAELVRRGEYASVERVDLGPAMSKAWLQVSHDIQLPGGKKLKSYSFMRVQNGYFVKLRISGPPESGQARLPAFLLGASRAIGLLGVAAK
ncbi:MAG TPA: hypothetical protein VGD45_09145 [Steroidobacter sp.]|uniref:hypothetical protein n=1 Tax=Steroidobacter sp. TaxID=1978227 RepID=UPI002EDA5428